MMDVAKKGQTPVSELSVLLSLFKGHRTTQEIVDGAALSRETFRKLQRGQGVKLSTLRDIATYLKLTRSQWLALVVAWIKLEVGEAEAKYLQIIVNETAGVPREVRQLQELALQLPPAELQQVILAISRPEVRLACIGLNRVYEELGKRKVTRTYPRKVARKAG